MNASPNFRRWLLPLMLLLLAFGLRLFKIDGQSIWWDEGHSIFVAQNPVSQIPTLPAMDVHPPGYFALLHGWMAVAGRSEFALRYLSLLFGMLIVALLWRFARELHTESAARLAALLAAVSPLLVAYSQEVRSYTLITLLALGSTFFLWRIVLPGGAARQSGFRKNVAGYVLLTAACLYTHYFTIFLLLFQNTVWLVWLVRRTGDRARSFPKNLALWLGTQAAVLLLFAPQLALAARQVSDYANPNLNPPSTAEFVGKSWQAYTTGLTLNPQTARWGMGAIAGVLLVSWALIFTRRRSKFIGQKFLFLLGWLVIPMAAYYVVLQQRPSFEPRYLMLVSPAIFLLLALGLSELRFTIYDLRFQRAAYASRFAFFGLTGLTLVALLTGLFSYYFDETYFKDDSAGVARWLAAETTATDIVYVDVPHPFHYYADRANIPAPVEYLFVDIHTAAERLNREAAGRRRLYWITWWGSDTDPRGVIQYLAEKTGRPAGARDFRGYHAEWFDLPPDAQFSLPATLPLADATFGNALQLDGAAFASTASPGEPVWAALHFYLLRDTPVNYKVSLRLRGPDGQVAAQVDRDLLNDRHFRTADWPPDDPVLNQAINVYLLPLPPDAPPGAYTLEAVLYNAEPPYPAEGVFGPQARPDNAAAILGTVEISP